MLSEKEDLGKKTITINLDSMVLLEVDRLAKAFSKVNPTKTFSRNSIIETSIISFLSESASVLLEEHGLNVHDDEWLSAEATIEEAYDLLVLPAHNEGFKKAFLGENAWYPFRIREDRIGKINYIAIYRAAPVSGITHYAKVDRITQFENTNKKKAHLDGPPIQLDHVVELGSSNANAFRSPRYTTLSKLLKAQEVGDLF